MTFLKVFENLIAQSLPDGTHDVPLLGKRNAALVRVRATKLIEERHALITVASTLPHNAQRSILQGRYATRIH
eukprot:6307530-Karenia_brevis.AAC.1